MLENYPIYIKILFFFTGAFLVSYVLLPKIILVAHEKQLLVHPNQRSSHKIVTPPFGGVAFFISFIVMFSFLRNEFSIYESNFIIPATTILFVVGLKDDLVSIAPRTKLMGQLTALLLVTASGEFTVHSLNGFLGIHEINPWMLMPVILFFMIGIINAYNLIDGVDGLASMIGMVIMAAYAYMFYQLGEYYYFLLTFIILGSFAAFLRFNITKNCDFKIFLGDTGSLFIGFIIAVLTMKLLTIPEVSFHTDSLQASNVPLIIGSILFIPFFDTTRVMLVRFFNNKPFFYPDRNHIHHLILDSGFSHIQTSLLIASLAILIITIVTQFSFLFDSYSLLGILALVYGCLFVFFHFLKRRIAVSEQEAPVI